MFDPVTVGFAGVGLAIVLMAIRVPIAVALGGTAIIGLWILRGPRAAFGALGTLPYDIAAGWQLSAVPMFLMLGAVAFHTGMTKSLFRAARIWLKGVPGGLAVATNIASAGFAAVSGSSTATTAAMGRIAIPEMLKLDYDKALATSVVAASGTLGALIPPSIAFVIYGWYAETSIGALLMAGIVPGLLTAAIYAAIIIGRCRINPSLAPAPQEHYTRAERIEVLRDIWPMPLLVVAVVGSIFGGLATPTEAGALGAMLALIISAVRSELDFSRLKAALIDTARATSVLFFIVIGAGLFTNFLAISRVPGFMTRLIGSAGVDPLLVILAMTAIFVVLGMILEGIGVMLLTLPVLLPIVRELHMDLVWFGVIVVKYVEIGLLTPPVGLNAFVVKSVVGDAVPLWTIFRGLTWFLAAEVIIMVLLIAFPELSLFLPSLMN